MRNDSGKKKNHADGFKREVLKIALTRGLPRSKGALHADSRRSHTGADERVSVNYLHCGLLWSIQLIIVVVAIVILIIVEVTMGIIIIIPAIRRDYLAARAIIVVVIGLPTADPV